MSASREDVQRPRGVQSRSKSRDGRLLDVTLQSAQRYVQRITCDCQRCILSSESSVGVV